MRVAVLVRGACVLTRARAQVYQYMQQPMAAAPQYYA